MNVRVVIVLMALMTLLIAGEKDIIDIERINKDTAIIKVPLNYEDPTKKVQRMNGLDAQYSIDLPLPEGWEVLSINGYLQYASSILLLKDSSAGLIVFNNVLIEQFKLFDNMKSGVKFSIDPELMGRHNSLKLEMIQHYNRDGCEDGSHSGLWSDINLEKSYLLFKVRIKPIEESISAIATRVFDDKQYFASGLHYVLSDDASDKELRNFMLFTSAAANSLKYRIAEISVSDHLVRDKHNIIISSKAKAKEMLRRYTNHFIDNITPKLALHFDGDAVNSAGDKTVVIQEAQNGVINYENSQIAFDTSKLELDNLEFVSDEISVAFWFKAEAQKQGVLFGFETYNLLYHNGYLGFNSENRDVYGRKFNLDGKYHHIVATFNRHNLNQNRLYIDGKEVRLRQVVGRADEINAEFSAKASIGGRLKDSSFDIKAEMNQFYLFDATLSQSDVRRLYTLSRKDKDKRLFLAEKLSHDINLIQNPKNPSEAIIFITPDSPEKSDELLYALFKNDLRLYKRQGLDINSVSIPEKAAAYSAKGYIPVGEKIYFNELGYHSTVLKGWYPPKVSLDFKVYPDNYFDDKDRIETHLKYVFPTTVRKDSVANIFLNDKFAKQIDISKAATESKLSLRTGALFNFDEANTLPAYLVNKGLNQLRFELSLVPNKDGHCAVFNSENLQAMIMDSSYFMLPDSKRFIEMPYLSYISMSTYPYSIYPDLQESEFIITNKRFDTIAAMMNFMFFLSQEMKGFPSHVHVSSNANSVDAHKHHIYFGTTRDADLQEVSKEAPISFDNYAMQKEYPFVQKFIKHKSIIDDERLEKHRFMKAMSESNQLDNNMIMQVHRSSSDGDKTDLMFVAQNPRYLNEGIKSLFKYTNRHLIQGDTLIYNYEDEDGVSYNIKEKYILTDMNLLDKLALILSANPVRYFFITLFILVLSAWLLRRVLLEFKRRKHADAE